MMEKDSLTDICDIVVDSLNERGLRTQQNSRFSRELSAITLSDRRDWLTKYVEQRTFLLLQGILDLAYQVNVCLHSHSPALVSVSEYILHRSMLEYAQRLIFLIDQDINLNERVKRAIRLYNEDIKAWNRLPGDLRRDAKHGALDTFLVDWYKDVNDGIALNLKRPLKVDEIFKATGNVEVKKWASIGGYEPENPVYKKGYAFWSAIDHGMTWAIRHYGLMSIDGNNRYAPRVNDSKTINAWQRLTAGLVAFPFVFADQFMSYPTDADIREKLGKLLEALQQFKANEQCA